MTRAPRVTTQPGRLIVLSGPSGVGKDTVLHELRRLDPSLRYSVSYTTRAPRPGEVDGVAYSFIDEATFRAMAERGEFLEWAEVHGHLYGTSEARVNEALERGEDIVLKIDVQGAAWIRPRVDGAVFIFLLPPSEDGAAPPPGGARHRGRGVTASCASATRSPSWPTARRTITAWSTTTCTGRRARSSTSCAAVGPRGERDRHLRGASTRRRPRRRQRRRVQGVRGDHRAAQARDARCAWP